MKKKKTYAIPFVRNEWQQLCDFMQLVVMLTNLQVNYVNKISKSEFFNYMYIYYCIAIYL